MKRRFKTSTGLRFSIMEVIGDPFEILPSELKIHCLDTPDYPNSKVIDEIQETLKFHFDHITFGLPYNISLKIYRDPKQGNPYHIKGRGYVHGHIMR